MKKKMTRAQQRAMYAKNGSNAITKSQGTSRYVGAKWPDSIKFNAEQKEQIRVMFEWGGCAVTPQYCAFIKGINFAYKICRTDNDNLVGKIAQIVAPEVVPIVFENQVDACSNKIIEQINEYGLIDNISKQANLDKSVFQDMMKGTISNLLDIGINNQVNSTIGKMWSL